MLIRYMGRAHMHAHIWSEPWPRALEPRNHGEMDSRRSGYFAVSTIFPLIFGPSGPSAK